MTQPRTLVSASAVLLAAFTASVLIWNSNGTVVASHVGHSVNSLAPNAISIKLVPPPPAAHLESGPYIDGATHPEQIPDDVSYQLMLRMLLPGGSTEEHHARQTSYIRHVLRRAGWQATDGDVVSVQAFVLSYEATLRALDQVSTEPAAHSTLVQEIVRTMPNYMNANLAMSLTRYATTTFKRTVKIIN